MPIRSRMSSIMGQIRAEHMGVICPWIWKNCWIWLCLHSIIYKYKPISTKLGQNACENEISDEFDHGSNVTRTAWVICFWIRKFAIFDFVYTLASANINQSVLILATTYMPIRYRMSSIMGQIEAEHLGHNIYAHQVSDEFDHGANQSRTSRVICPWIWKNCWIWLCLCSSINKY